MKALRITGIAEIIEVANDFRALQRAVDGHLEAVAFADDAVVIVDEEGLLKGKFLFLCRDRRRNHRQEELLFNQCRTSLCECRL